MNNRILAVTVGTVLLSLSAGAAAAEKSFGDYVRGFLGGSSDNSETEQPNTTRVAGGLRQALQAGASRAVAELGRQNGFWGDKGLRIPLPPVIEKTAPALRAAGYGSQLDSFRLTLNRAAEQATGEVGGIFKQVISDLSVRDAYQILQGGENAATQYLRRNSEQRLTQRIQPIVSEATASTGVTRKYKNLVNQAGPLLKLAGGGSADLDAFVTDRALDSLFTVIAREEADIRANPTERTSEIVREVFSK